MTSRVFNANVISKTFAILRAFTDQKSAWGVNELARYLDIPVSSLHRNLKTLREEKVLQLSAQTGKYIVGPELIRMASIVSSQIEIKNIARPFMQEVSTTFDEPVYLGLYYPQYKKISFVEKVNSQNPLQYVLEVGILHPIHFAASGKVVLAFLNEKEIQRVFTEETISEKEQTKIRQELNDVREKGYLITLEERLTGATGTAAPIFDAAQNIVGCITCVIPLNHYDDQQAFNVAYKVMEEADKISRTLGYQYS